MICIVAMLAAGGLEFWRLLLYRQGHVIGEDIVNLNVFFQVPQYLLIGLSEVPSFLPPFLPPPLSPFPRLPLPPLPLPSPPSPPPPLPSCLYSNSQVANTSKSLQFGERKTNRFL